MIENMSHVCTSAATLFFSAIIPFLGDPPLLVHELPVGLSEYTADCGQGGHVIQGSAGPGVHGANQNLP